MSYLSKFVFNPIKAAIARGATSSSPVTQATAVAASAAIAKISADVSNDAMAHNSAIGVSNALVADLETGIKNVVDSFVASAVTNGVPLVGGMLAPEAVKIADVALAFVEQHALNYVSALFAHHKAAVNAPASAQ